MLMLRIRIPANFSMDAGAYERGGGGGSKLDSDGMNIGVSFSISRFLTFHII